DNPSLAGIVIKDSKTSDIVRKVNCGGKHYKDYTTGPGLLHKKEQKSRDLPVEDFYLDWAGAEFGENVAESLAKIFIKLDGGEYSPRKKETNLPRPSDWIGGPGGILINKNPWNQEKDRYSFVEEMGALRSRVSGAGNLYRFDYWLNTFRFLRAVGEIGCMRGGLDRIMEKIESTKDGSKQDELARKAVEIRITLARQWEKMITLLLQTVETPGELGTVANCEQHVRRNNRAGRFLDLHDEKLEELLGEPLPAGIHPTTKYQGKERIIVLTRRSRLEKGEILTISVILLDNKQPRSTALYWRSMGENEYQKFVLDHEGRAVYSVTLPAASEDDIEYYIEAVMGNGNILYWPATAPELNQTIVVN
ncbi:hypothetical protein KA005_29875, partial [bacterium]|nr:hypothetical protein [bacterium]